MKIKESIKKTGNFWLPPFPNAVRGTLSISNEEGIVLEVDQNLSPEDIAILYDAPEKRVESLPRGAREFAKIPLLFRTDSHTTLETAIHKHLELQHKTIRKRPSKEWFLTNPGEVVKIVAEINFDLLRPAYNFSAILSDME